MFKWFTRGRPADTASWTTEQWRSHLLSAATSPSERSDIEAMFARAM